MGNGMQCCKNSLASSVPQDRVAGYRGKSAVAQGITGVQHEGEDCTIRLVEEFRASDKSGDWCQIPQRRRGTSVIDAKTMLAGFINNLLEEPQEGAHLGLRSLACLRAGGMDPERRSHIQHIAPCRPCVPPPKRSRRSGDCVDSRWAGSLGGTVRLVLIFRGSRSTSGKIRGYC